MRDMTGSECTFCFAGKYRETSSQDDIDGVLHCITCDHQIPRWKTAGEMGLPEMLPCPFCGFEPDVCNDDALYPVGRDRKVWGAHCYETGGGCSASMLGYSAVDAVNAWNRRANDNTHKYVMELIITYNQMLDAKTSEEHAAARRALYECIDQLQYEKTSR